MAVPYTIAKIINVKMVLKKRFFVYDKSNRKLQLKMPIELNKSRVKDIWNN